MSRPLLHALRRNLVFGLLLVTAAQAHASAQGPAPSKPVQQPVGTSSPSFAAELSFSREGVFTTQDIQPGVEFHLAPGGTCRIGQHYAAASTCTVNVTFQPTAPGASHARLTLRTADGKPIASTILRGNGLGSVVAFSPGALAPVVLDQAAISNVRAIAADAAGNLVLVDSASSTLLRVDASTGVISVLDRPSSLPSNSSLAQTRALAVATDGSIYLLQSNGTVLHRSPEEDHWIIVPTGLESITAITLDVQDHLLLARSTQIFRFEAGKTTTIAGASACAPGDSTCGDGGPAINAQFQAISSITTDADGNIYLADTGAARIRRIDAQTGFIQTIAGTGTVCTSGLCGDAGPATAASVGTLQGIALDPVGNLYLVERERGLRRIDAATGQISSVLPASATPQQAIAAQLSTLRDGSVALLSAHDASVSRFTAAASALAFAQTPVGQTSSDGPQTVNLTNLGNRSATLVAPIAGTNPSTGADFPLAAGQTCPQLSASSSASSLTPGEHCALQVKFRPTTSGNLTSSLVVTESSTAAVSRHTIALAGTATAAASTLAGISFITLPASLVYGQTITLVATVYSTTSGPTPTGTINFTEGSTTLAQNVALSGGLGTYTITLPSVGDHTYAVAYSGDSNYAASAQNVTTAKTVARAGSVLTVPSIVTTQSQDIRVPFYLSGQYSGTGIALPTQALAFQLYDKTGARVRSGLTSSQNLVNSVAEIADFGIIDTPGRYTVHLDYPGDINFLPTSGDYPVNIRSSQTISFAPIASPVLFGTPPIALSATSSSGLPVSFLISSGPATINSSNQLVITGLGTIVVVANQAGNDDYSPAPQVEQTVLSVRPFAQLTWPAPAPIYVGTPLGSTQLNASVTDANGQPLPGTITYTPPAGTFLPVGSHILNVSFTPTDTEHYGTKPITGGVTIAVREIATPAITFNGGTVLFGNPLGNTLQATVTFNGSAVPGTLTFTTGGSTITAASVLPVGSYPVTASFTPANTAAFQQASATATVIVAKAAARVTLATSASPVAPGTNVTFTSNITGGPVAPTGTVQFQTGSTILGTVAVSASGQAALTTNSLPTGAFTITAIYSGDAAYNDANATVTEVVSDFTLTANTPTTVSVLPSKVATYTFAITPAGAPTFLGDITFKLTGLPTGATYKLTPASIAAGGSATTVTLAVTAPATLRAEADPAPRGKQVGTFALALLALPFAARLRRRSMVLCRSGVLATVLLLSFALAAATGCGSGVGYFDQAQQNFPLTLTASSGTVSHTASVTLQVQ